MIFLDTSYLLAVLNPRDSLYRRAQFWTAAIREPLVVTEYVLWELVNTFSLPEDRPKAHQAIERLRTASDCELVPATPVLFEAGLKLHRERTDKEWSLTDCVSFLVMQERGILRALSHDHHFEQAGFVALLRSELPTH